MRVRFEDFEVDDIEFELRAGGAPIELEPQVFKVLSYLVANAGRLVTKEELLDQVWGDRFVSESALTSRIKAARKCIGDDGRNQRLIKTVHGKGYRFVGDTVQADEDAGLENNDADLARHNLPRDRTKLFGRDDDIDSVIDLLTDHRLVSLLGIGGSGKTRLALASARRVLDQYPDGVWFTDLVPASDAESVTIAVAHAVGLGLASGSSSDQVSQLLTNRRALVILDNCEHVIDHAASMLDLLLDRTAAPRFLVTSREPLDLVDEQRFNVEPLDVDNGKGRGAASAVELFISCASRFGTPVDELDQELVAAVCRQLDGLPLAIELAAAQLRHLTLPELVERLGQRLEFDSGGRSGSARHQRQTNLLAVLEDSWSALGPDEQAMLAQLAVFPGPFRLTDLEQVARHLRPGLAARSLAALTDRSLVTREAGPDRRFRVLETVRLFSEQRTSPTQRLRFLGRHAAWCSDVVGSDPAHHLYDFDFTQWCFEHHDDLVAAERFLRDSGDHNAAAELLAGSGLRMHLDIGSHAADALRRIDDHLRLVDDPDLVARLHLAGVLSAMAARDPERIAGHGRSAVEFARQSSNPSVLAVALVLASWSTVFVDADEAIALVTEARAVSLDNGDSDSAYLADGYRVLHLATDRRYGEARDLARTLVGDDPSVLPSSYPRYVCLVGFVASHLFSDPEDVRAWLPSLLDFPSRAQAMWANQLLVASALASVGDQPATRRLLSHIHSRLDHAGQDGLPDLLIPPAILAWRNADHDRARRWITAVRRAGRPTQSFQTTITYRQLRELVGLSAENPLDHTSLEAIGEEARAWLDDLVDSEP